MHIFQWDLPFYAVQKRCWFHKKQEGIRCINAESIAERAKHQHARYVLSESFEQNIKDYSLFAYKICLFQAWNSRAIKHFSIPDHCIDSICFWREKKPVPINK
jgi:hypothetical protein